MFSKNVSVGSQHGDRNWSRGHPLVTCLSHGCLTWVPSNGYMLTGDFQDASLGLACRYRIPGISSALNHNLQLKPVGLPFQGHQGQLPSKRVGDCLVVKWSGFPILHKNQRFKSKSHQSKLPIKNLPGHFLPQKTGKKKIGRCCLGHADPHVEGLPHVCHHGEGPNGEQSHEEGGLGQRDLAHLRTNQRESLGAAQISGGAVPFCVFFGGGVLDLGEQCCLLICWEGGLVNSGFCMGET